MVGEPETMATRPVRETGEPAPCCRNLRCKSMEYRADERPGLLHASTTMTYWCALTSADLGPDDAVVDHGRCQRPRTCCDLGDQLV